MQVLWAAATRAQAQGDGTASVFRNVKLFDSLPPKIRTRFRSWWSIQSLVIDTVHVGLYHGKIHSVAYIWLYTHTLTSPCISLHILQVVGLKWYDHTSCCMTDAIYSFVILIASFRPFLWSSSWKAKQLLWTEVVVILFHLMQRR